MMFVNGYMYYYSIVFFMTFYNINYLKFTMSFKKYINLLYVIST
jgi:hypothetical protein